MAKKQFRVAELFAGVGGFRLGLEGPPSEEWETEELKFENTGFKVVWSNQWEPGSSKQWASTIYEKRFKHGLHSNEDIHDIALNKGSLVDTIRERVPEHDLLVGGFPCQDYSVARTVSGELGIKGEKGKLWVPIKNIIDHSRSKNGQRPLKMILLENVPRLLNSPALARGRNFALILHELLQMSYHVEWRVINAADYGMPQQRRRVFILAYRNSNYGTPDTNGKPNYGCRKAGARGPMRKWLLNKAERGANPNWEVGPFAKAFPCDGDLPLKAEFLPADLESFTKKDSPFGNVGYAWKKKKHTMPDGTKLTDVKMYWTTKAEVKPNWRMKLKDALETDFDPKYEVDASRIEEWIYAKGNKNEFRIRKSDRKNVDPDLLELYDFCMNADCGERASLWTLHRDKFLKEVGLNKFYRYDEGMMGFDDIDSPSRTVVTAEIGTSPSRMRHIFMVSPGRYRRLSPVETERLNMFPDNWTNIDGISDSRRGFLMGNALVVGIIQRLREPLYDLLNSRDS